MNSLKGNYLYRLGSQVLLFFVPLILIPYTSRTLGPDNLGIYSYTLSMASLFSNLGKLGLGTYGKLQIAQNRDDIETRDRVFCELASIELLLTAITAAIYSLFIVLFSKFRVESFLMLLCLVGEAIDISWFYEGLEQYKRLAVLRFIIKMLNLTFVLLFVNGKHDLYPYIIVMQGAVFVNSIALWCGMRGYIKKPRIILNRNSKIHLKHVFVYFLPTIANLIYNVLDRVMLGYLGNSTVQSGFYEQSYRIIGMAQAFVLAFGTVSLPRLTYLYSSGRKDSFVSIVSKVLRVSMLLLLPMSVGLFFNAELIVRTVLGEQFLGGTGVLRVLSILIIFASLNYNIGYPILVSTERQKEFNIGVFSGACLNFTLNLLLIRRFYAVGAAVGSLAAEMIIYVAFVIFSKKIVGLKTLFPRALWKYLLATGIMIVCNAFLKTHLSNCAHIIQLVLIITICAALYFTTLLCMKEEETLNLFKQIGNKLRLKA